MKFVVYNVAEGTLLNLYLDPVHKPLSYLVLYESSCLKLSASKFMASIINLFFCSIFLLEFTQALKFLLQLMDAIGNLLISWQEV